MSNKFEKLFGAMSDISIKATDQKIETGSGDEVENLLYSTKN